MLITRKAEFSASHVCSQPSLSEEENRKLYGEAANPRGHGHNYVLEVTLDGEPDPVTGMVFDLKRLKDTIQRAVPRSCHPPLQSAVPHNLAPCVTAQLVWWAFTGGAELPAPRG